MPKVVAGGIVAPDIQQPLTARYQVAAQTAARTESDTYVYMDEMRITINPAVACDVLVLFSGTFEQSGMNIGACGIALYMDGVQKAETLLSPYTYIDYSGDWPVPHIGQQNGTVITALKDIAPGPHTLEMRFRGNRRSGDVERLIVRSRMLTAVLFYR